MNDDYIDKVHTKLTVFTYHNINVLFSTKVYFILTLSLKNMIWIHKYCVLSNVEKYILKYEYQN